MRKVTVGDFKVTKKMRTLVNQVLDSNRLSYGPMCKDFEGRLSKIHGCEFGVISNSGTSSLQVALQTLKEVHGWNDGDEVLVPAITFVATINAVLHNNLKPVLVDIERDHYCIKPHRFSGKISDKTRAIIPVHLFGQPANMLEIASVAKLYKLKIIEDSCETMFVSNNGKMVGSWGDIGCFSTYIAHLITTGVGGMATTNNLDYAKKMRSLVNHGWDREVRPVDIKGFDINEVKSRYRFSSVGHSYRITELEAAIGLAQLDSWKDMVKKRQNNAHFLVEQLKGIDSLQLPAEREKGQHAYMMFPVILKDGNKWQFMEHLENNKIETREMLPITNQACYPWIKEEDYPVAQWVNERGFYIGIHQFLTEEQLIHIVSTIDKFFDIRSNLKPWGRYNSKNELTGRGPSG